MKKTTIRQNSQSPLRDYRNIYTQVDPESPARKEFRKLKLKQKVDPDQEFLIDLRKVGSPAKKGNKGSRAMSRDQDNMRPSSSMVKRVETQPDDNVSEIYNKSIYSQNNADLKGVNA